MPEATAQALPTWVPLSQIHPNPQNRQISQDQIDSLAASIKATDLERPILLRPKDSGYEIVCGHRRFLACQKLGWEQIQAVIQDLSDDQALLKGSLDNLGEDLGWFDRALLAERLMSSGLKMTQDQVADSLALDPAIVSNEIKLLKILNNSARGAILENFKKEPISESAVQQLLNLKDSDPELITQTLEILLKHQMNAKQAGALVKWVQAGKSPDSFPEKQGAKGKGAKHPLVDVPEEAGLSEILANNPKKAVVSRQAKGGYEMKIKLEPWELGPLFGATVAAFYRIEGQPYAQEAKIPGLIEDAKKRVAEAEEAKKKQAEDAAAGLVAKREKAKTDKVLEKGAKKLAGIQAELDAASADLKQALDAGMSDAGHEDEVAGKMKKVSKIRAKLAKAKGIKVAKKVPAAQVPAGAAEVSKDESGKALDKAGEVLEGVAGFVAGQAKGQLGKLIGGGLRELMGG